jgi:bifunctional polynucleotide phosphatase/kinase
MPGMWSELERIFAQDGITIGKSYFYIYLLLVSLSEAFWSYPRPQDKKDSYLVGDAAGRPDDFASTDRKFALNVGIQFYTPEVKLFIIRMEWNGNPS